MRDVREQLAAVGATVVLVSFGSRQQALRLLEETEAPFRMLLDPERKVYQAYGLDRSVVKVFHPKLFLLYFRLLLLGRKLLPVQGDPYQLGGDFIIDRHKIVRYAHPSDNPADRPTVQDLLAALRGVEARSKVTKPGSADSDKPAA